MPQMPKNHRSSDVEQGYDHQQERLHRIALQRQYQIDYLSRNESIAEDNRLLLQDPDGTQTDDKPVNILVQFGTWAVTSYGIEHIDTYHYHVDYGRIVGDSDEHWLSHMRQKNWVVYEDFLLAYHTCKQLFTAMKKHGVPLRELIEDKD